jgi:tryptophan synthase beta chain
MAAAIRLAPTLPRRAIVLVNLSGRGDKDMETVAEYLGIRLRDPGEERA